MAEYPSLPLFTDAYLADTTHLTDAEHGIYVLLLIHLWRSPDCRIPNDKQWIARKLRKTVEEVADEVMPLVGEFCQTDGNWITQKRLKKEFQYLKTRSEQQSARAKSRWGKETTSCRADAAPHASGSTGSDAGSMRPRNAPHPTPPNKKEKKPPEPAKLMVDVWNQVCVEAGLAKVLKLHTTRTRKLEKRLTEDFRGLMAEWQAFCAQIAASPFLTGRNDRGWKADLDWVIEPRNFAKIVEGNYDDRSGTANGHDQGPYLAEGEEDLRTDYRRLMRWQANGEWMPHWGPKPGEPGCQIAAQVMTQHGQRNEPDVE